MKEDLETELLFTDSGLMFDVDFIEGTYVGLRDVEDVNDEAHLVRQLEDLIAILGAREATEAQRHQSITMVINHGIRILNSHRV